MRAPPRHHEPHPRYELRSAAAQTEQAAAARRYLRRRREVLLCVLVSLLGVLVARSIPLVAHEQELCACRAGLLRASPPPAHVVTGVAWLRAHPGSTPPPGSVLLAFGEEGAWAATPGGHVVLADRCAESLR